MKIGVLADIHGNAHALAAVLDDCRQRQIDSVLLLGDLFAKGPNPRRVYELLAGCHILENVIGNTDRWFLQQKLDNRQRAMVEFGAADFPEIRNYIRGMKEYAIQKYGPLNSLLIHAWPRHIVSAEQQDYLRKSAIGMVLSAHTHIPSSETDNGILYLNPGSIGIPYDHDKRASYGILSTGLAPGFEVIRVSYDYDLEIASAHQKQIPYAGEYTKILLQGEK